MSPQQYNVALAFVPYEQATTVLVILKMEKICYGGNRLSAPPPHIQTATNIVTDIYVI